MSRDAIFNNLQSTYVSNVPVFSLSNAGSRVVPTAGSLMYNVDDSFLYVSNGPGVGWAPVGQGAGGAIHVTDTTQSTSCDTGSITTLGGVGVAGNFNVCGTLSVAGGSTLSGQTHVTNSTPSSDPTTGALVVSGGVGIGGDLFVGGTVRATQLATTGADVIVSGAAPPTTGQVLTATSATAASWEDISSSSIIGVLPVANGGTGDSTLTPNGVLVGNGTSPVTTNKQAPTGAFMGTTDTQTITNKTITDHSNIVTASSLATTGNPVSVVALPPTVGQVLTIFGFGSGNAYWATPTQGPAIQLATSGSPVTVNGTSPVAGDVLVTTSTTNANWIVVDGTYSPTFSNSMGTGILGATAPGPFMYNRFGNNITVTGVVNLTQTNANINGDSIDVTLPFDRNTAASYVNQAYGYVYPNYLYPGSQIGGYISAIVGSLIQVRLYIYSQTTPVFGAFNIFFTYSIV